VRAGTRLKAVNITDGPIFRSLGKHGNVRSRRLTDHTIFY